MSFSTLYIGTSAIRAAQTALETAGHNIANVNTPGYSRQRVELETARPNMGTFGQRGTGHLGAGVTVADVVRIRSTLVDSAYRAEASNEAWWGARAELMGRAEQVLGPLDGGAGSALDSFFASFDELALYPADDAPRRGVIDAGTFLARQLRSAAAQLGELDTDTTALIRQSVDEVNSLASELSRLNAAIKEAVVGDLSPNDLLDRRDAVLDDLVALTGATIRENEFLQADVYLGGRTIVREAKFDQLAVTTTTPPGIAWAEDGATVTVAGRTGALVDFVTTTIPSLQAQLDDVALGLRDAVNAQHSAGFDRTGAPGADFFVGTGAADLDVNPGLAEDQIAASAGGAASDGNNALALADLRNQPAVGSQTVSGALTAFGARLGNLAAEADTAAASSGTVLNGIAVERASVQSVNLDEELADLVRYQRHFEAAARVITTVDELLDTLINHTGIVGR